MALGHSPVVHHMCCGSEIGSYLPSFSCGPWGCALVCLVSYFPSTNLVDRADDCYTSLYFLFLPFFYVSSIQNFKICYLILSVLFLCSFLPSIISIAFSSLLSIPYSVCSFCLFTLFSDFCYCFLLKSVILSFFFSYYSILSASIPFVLFLLVFIFLDPSISYFAISFALASVFFMFLLFGKDL